MNDELLTDILAVECDIRLQIDALEQQTAERLGALKQKLEQMLESESMALHAELELELAKSGQSAQREADALLAEARAFTLRLENIDTQELERVVIRHLARTLPEGGQ